MDVNIFMILGFAKLLSKYDTKFIGIIPFSVVRILDF